MSSDFGLRALCNSTCYWLLTRNCKIFPSFQSFENLTEARGHLVKKKEVGMKKISEWYFLVFGAAKNLNPPLSRGFKCAFWVLGILPYSFTAHTHGPKNMAISSIFAIFLIFRVCFSYNSPPRSARTLKFGIYIEL